MSVLTERDYARFVDPAVAMSVWEQIEFGQDFNRDLGLSPPSLNDGQQFLIAKTAEQHESYRVVPTFLPHLVWLRPNSIKPEGLLHIYEEELAGEEGQGWGDLWTKEGGTVIQNDAAFQVSQDKKPVDREAFADRLFGLRYKTPDGRVVSRNKYLSALRAAGLAISGLSDGGLWTFPVMDVSDSMNRGELTPDILFKGVDSMISPEARINVQLLHMRAGKPRNEDVTEIVNEAVYLLDGGGDQQAFRAATGITWSKSLGGRIRLAMWSKQFFREAQAPNGLSGL